MAISDALDAIIKRIEAGIWTEADLIALRRVLTSGEQTVQQLAKYNVNIGQGQDIHIGDRTYYSWNDEALRALACMIHFGIQISDGESIRSKIREKQTYYQDKIREVNRGRDDRLSQLKSEYQNNLMRIETDHHDNLRRIETEHRNERNKEIEQILLEKRTEKSRVEQDIKQKQKKWSEANKGGPASNDVNYWYAQQLSLARQYLVKLEREIEFWNQNRFRAPSEGPRVRADEYFAGEKLKLFQYSASRKETLESNLQRDRAKTEASAADEIKKIEKDGRGKIYRFIIQVYLFKEGYPFSHKSLDELKQIQLEIKIEKDEIETIEESEIKPFYQKNLNKYKEFFTRIINKEGYPLSEKARTELNQEQELLGLKGKDVNFTEELITKPFYQKQLIKYKEEFSQIISAEGYPLSETARHQLKQKQISLGLSCGDINSTEELVIKPFYEENLTQYKNGFIELMSEKVNMLTQESLAELRKKQKTLGLKSEDIKFVEQLIIKQFYQINLYKYEKEFNQVVNREDRPLGRATIAQLRQRQELLGIKVLGFNSKDIEIVKRLLQNNEEKGKTVDYLSSDLFKESYQKMRNLLASYYWKEANEETRNILFTLAKSTKQNENNPVKISEEQMRIIDILQLRVIDILWDVYSKGKFGFHKQRKRFDLAGKNYKAFSENIGWKKRTFFLLDFLSWNSDNDIMFNIDAPQGHLPFWRPYIINPEQFLMKLSDLDSNL